MKNSIDTIGNRTRDLCNLMKDMEIFSAQITSYKILLLNHCSVYGGDWNRAVRIVSGLHCEKPTYRGSIPYMGKRQLVQNVQTGANPPSLLMSE